MIKDKKILELIKNEINRQQTGLVMIPSENYASQQVLDAMGTPLSNKYSEGYPQKRYYSGNSYIDEIEIAAIERAKGLFNMEHANVQPHSGSSANLAVFFALLNQGDKILSMDLNAGGHLTHGSPVNFAGKTYEIISYGVSPDGNTIDYDEIEALAQKETPKMIISGATSYPRQIDFVKITEIAHKVGAYHLADVSHVAGLIVGGVHPTAESADVITSTTHKTLRGPRGAVILCKKELASKIDRGVFPGMQGGPLDHVIAAKAICFGEAQTPEFKEYAKQTVSNAKTLEKVFKNANLRLLSGGTDNHLLLIDVTPLGIDGEIASAALEEAGIYVNKNVIPFETKKPMTPSGIRLGTPALTTRGMKEEEMAQIGEFIVEVLHNSTNEAKVEKVKGAVTKLCKEFPIYSEFGEL